MTTDWKLELAHKAIEALQDKGYSKVTITDIRQRNKHLCICATINNQCFFSCGTSINTTVENLLNTVQSGLSVGCTPLPFGEGQGVGCHEVA